MATTLHFGVTNNDANPTGVRATLRSELAKHRMHLPMFVTDGDSFTAWGETDFAGTDDQNHVTLTLDGPVSIPDALAYRAALQRIVSPAGLRVIDYVVRTDADDHSEDVATCGIGALANDSGKWDALNA